MPINYGVEGKVIALTGAASGIGFATSMLLASQGAYLSVADVNEGPLLEAVEKFKAAASPTAKVMHAVVDVRKDSPGERQLRVEDVARLLG